MKSILFYSIQKSAQLLRLFIRLFMHAYEILSIRPAQLPTGYDRYHHPDDIWRQAQFSSNMMRRFFLTATAALTPLDGVDDNPTTQERINRRNLCENLKKDAKPSKQKEASAQIKILNNIIAGELSVREQTKRNAEEFEQKKKRAVKRLKGRFENLRNICAKIS